MQIFLFAFLIIIQLVWGFPQSYGESESEKTTLETEVRCEIHEVNGFLKNVCDLSPELESNIITMKCINSDQYYHNIDIITPFRTEVPSADVLCENDPYFYQACTTKSQIAYSSTASLTEFEDHTPCGYMCHKNNKGLFKGDFILRVSNNQYNKPKEKVIENTEYDVTACDGKKSCKNTDMDEENCKDMSRECDMVCSGHSFRGVNMEHECEDERFCDGFHYGFVCKTVPEYWDFPEMYIAAHRVCDDRLDCFDGSDEDNCSISGDEASCWRSLREYGYQSKVPLFNFTRCAARFDASQYSEAGMIIQEFCIDFLDQTNCSDPSRIGLTCDVRGYATSVAEQIICINKNGFSDNDSSTIPKICDDGLDKACVRTSSSCLVHKHLMCDSWNDCKDLSDESRKECTLMTTKRCHRRYKQQSSEKIPFPMAWIRDGVYDCSNNEDEEAKWPSCGQGKTFRLCNVESDCGEVFLCPKSEGQDFVELKQLCDKKEPCINEDKVCSASRAQIIPNSVAIRNLDGTLRFSFCFDGLQNLGRLENIICRKIMYTFPRGKVFGRNNSYTFVSPDVKVDCRHLYGEYHVLTSCSDNCLNTPCLIKKPIKWDSCPRQFENKKVFTQGHDNMLTFLILDSRSGKFGSDLFQCNNSKCVTYDKVCNLVDDCKDASDESSCTNHFQCLKSKEYLPITQKCDNTYHCSDKSDECNESCGREIISIPLTMVSWIVGILAIALNLRSMSSSKAILNSCKSEPALLTNSLILLIGIGDLLTGLYLTTIAGFTNYYGAEYCWKHLDWITGDTCLVLGVISTVGAQISLFSMTILSLLRLFGITADFVVPNDITVKSKRKVVGVVIFIFTAALGIALLPSIASLEDFFVNGVKYADENSLFFGTPDKTTHMTVFKEYFGRISRKKLTWTEIERLINTMFSNDYGGINRKKLSFYGNDAVCLFKYFVTKDDPQRNYVFGVLCLNFLCFVTIAVAYVRISAVAKKSFEQVTETEGVKKKYLQLQRKTQWIILTDFSCWVPFIFICCCHFTELLNATPWYAYFSILVLPINSVINPIIYDSGIRTGFNSMCSYLRLKLIELFRSWSVRVTAHENEDIELENTQNRANNEAIGPDNFKNNENPTP